MDSAYAVKACAQRKKIESSNVCAKRPCAMSILHSKRKVDECNLYKGVVQSCGPVVCENSLFQKFMEVSLLHFRRGKYILACSGQKFRTCAESPRVQKGVLPSEMCQTTYGVVVMSLSFEMTQVAESEC